MFLCNQIDDLPSGSTYMVVRLFNISSKTGKNAYFVFLGCFCPYVGQPHGHIGWAKSMSFASINPNSPKTNPWNFHKKFLRIGDFEKFNFVESTILELIFFFLLLHPHENQSKLLGYQGWVEILMITLVYSKRVSVRNNLLHSVWYNVNVRT